MGSEQYSLYRLQEHSGKASLSAPIAGEWSCMLEVISPIPLWSRQEMTRECVRVL